MVQKSLSTDTRISGIVTKITSKTYPINAVWGSVRIFSIDQMPAILSAVREYQTAPAKDLYANSKTNSFPFFTMLCFIS